MVCSMVKKGVVAAALGAGALYLAFGTLAPSYVRTAFHKGRDAVKSSVPPQFDIDRARDEIASLEPAIRDNIEMLARSEVDVEYLDREIAAVRDQPRRREEGDRGDAREPGDGRLPPGRARLVHGRRDQGRPGPPARPLPQRQPDPRGEGGDAQGQAEGRGRRPPAAQEHGGAEEGAAGEARRDRGPAQDDRGHPGDERLQLRRQRPGPRQADRRRARQAARRDGPLRRAGRALLRVGRPRSSWNRAAT